MTNRTIDTIAEGVVFDDLGRITNHNTALGPFVYSYVDATRRPQTLTAPSPNSQVATYSYLDNLHDQRLETILNKNGSGVQLSRFDYQYDVLGRIKQWTRQTDSSTPQVMNLDYDNDDQLKSAISSPQGQAASQAYAYDYDDGGNRTVEQIESMTPSPGFSTSLSSYNQVNQLTDRALGPVMFRGTIDKPGTVTVDGQAAKMTQDPASPSNGKIFQASENLSVGQHTVSITAANLNNYATTKYYSLTVNPVESRNYSYDDNGNCLGYTAASGSRSYEWDAEDRLVAINNGSARTEFTYDGLSRWVKIVEKNNGQVTATRQFIWCGRTLCEERDVNNNVVKCFYPEAEKVMNGTSLFYTRDHLGSIREATGPQGLIRARYDYDPYGRRTKVAGDLDADFGFTGHFYHAPSGLHLALYRAYDADTGRWPNRDPLGERGGLNLYGYVHNRPTTKTDYLGRDENDPPSSATYDPSSGETSVDYPFYTFGDGSLAFDLQIGAGAALPPLLKDYLAGKGMYDLARDVLRKIPRNATDPTVCQDLSSSISRMEATEELLAGANTMTDAEAAAAAAGGFGVGGALGLLFIGPALAYGVTQIPLPGEYSNVADAEGAFLYWICPSCFQ